MTRISRRRLLAMTATSSLAGVIGSAVRPALGSARAAAGVPQRREVRDLSLEQWTAYVAAVKQLHSGPAPTAYDRLSAAHYQVGSGAHGSPGFFPWHRLHLRAYERRLQQIDPNVTVPYWDATRDAASPETSVVLSRTYFGGNGGDGRGGVLKTGPFADWQVSTPTPHLLQRSFSNGTTIPSWPSPEILENLLYSQRSYDGLRQRIEGTIHALIHTGIGGTNGDMSFMYSPNDPLHWSAHTFVDLIWAEWQARHPNLANTYPTDPHRTKVAQYGVPVSSTFDTTALGYTYPRWSAQPAG